MPYFLTFYNIEKTRILCAGGCQIHHPGAAQLPEAPGRGAGGWGGHHCCEGPGPPPRTSRAVDCDGTSQGVQGGEERL